MSYCDFAGNDPLHRAYHDHEYGFPLRSDSELFERLMLEINQAGLSWTTILRKRQNFRRAYDGFDPHKVAAYRAQDKARLLADVGIVRNRLKIDAAIENARRIIAMRDEPGSFRRWLDANHPLPKEQWVKLFKQTFVFTGGEITGEFLLSTGYLAGAHDEKCAVYQRVLKARPPWARLGASAATAAKKRPRQDTRKS